MNIRDFADKYIQAENEAFTKGDFTALEKTESKDVVYHRGFRGELVGFYAHEQDIRNFRQFTTDVKQEWEYLTGDGNICALNYKGSYKSTDAKSGAPVGKTMSFEALCVLQIKGGKLIDVWANGSNKIID